MQLLQVDLLLPLGMLLINILLLLLLHLLELFWLRLNLGFILRAWLLVIEVLCLRAACLTRLFSGVEHGGRRSLVDLLGELCRLLCLLETSGWSTSLGVVRPIEIGIRVGGYLHWI